jgi:hypothetical protein
MRAKSSTQRSLYSESNQKMSLDTSTQVQVHDHVKIKIILSYFSEEISVLSVMVEIYSNYFGE